MKGIVIITAGREDAYQDYIESIKEGIPLENVERYVSEEHLQMLAEGDEDRVRLWGTTAEDKWNRVERGDIVLIYREGKFIGRARAIVTEDNPTLAEHLWEADSPWRFLLFMDQFEEINVPLEEFNALVDYEDNYIPQGFTRVADRRVRHVLNEYESLENAIF